MNKFLTNSQISFVLYCVIVGYGIINIPKIAVQGGNTSGWISLIITTIIFSILAYIIVYLQYVYEGKTLYEYSEQLVGKVITYIITILYSIYFFVFFTMLIRVYGEVISITILYKTPVKYISLLFYVVIYYALIKGLDAIARLSQIYGFLSILGFIFINSMVCTKGRLVNIRPFFNAGDLTMYFEGFKEIIFPFIGTEVLFFIPINRTNNKNIFKYILVTLTLIGILYIFIAETNISIMGAKALLSYRHTIFSIIKGIDLDFLEFFRRLDGLYMIFWTMNVISAIAIWGYGAVVFANKFVKAIQYKWMAFIITIISFIVSEVPKTAEEVEVILKYNSYLGVILAGVLPIILLIITKVKNYDKEIS